MNELWENIFEQENAKKILDNFFSIRRVPHAFIFSGSDGVGKFNTAVEYCKILYSQFDDRLKENALKKIANLQEPVFKYICPLPRGKNELSDDSSTDKLSEDQLKEFLSELRKKIENPFYKIEIDGANTIKISSIREIKKFMTSSYDEFPLRFIVIDDAHFMNDQSQNALLKSLEEPPEGFYFFILTNSTDKLLPTIVSRCWKIEFEPLSRKTISELLVNRFGIDKKQADKAAIFSEGSLQRAILLLQNQIDQILESIITFLRFAMAKRYNSAFFELNNLLTDRTSEELKLIISLIKIWFNDAVKNQFDFDNYYYIEFQDTFKKFNDRYGKSDLESLIDRLTLLEESCDRNLNLNVLALNLIFELSGLKIRK